jgi:hypothetical protein
MSRLMEGEILRDGLTNHHRESLKTAICRFFTIVASRSMVIMFGLVLG